MPLSTQLIGVDGGATQVKVHDVAVVLRGGAPALRLSENSASASYPRVPGFTPPAEAGPEGLEPPGPPTPAEREQGWAWIESTAQCVLEVARRRGARQVLLGIAMPGRKTPDGRGIEFALNGPRIPRFVERLEERLRLDGLEFAAPIARLESDGWCCGLGEEAAEEGLFRGVDDAYYLGGGTGLAESLKLRGGLVRLESIEGWFPRAWKLRDASGKSYDRSLSAAGLNSEWADRVGFEVPLARGRLPEERVRTDERAQELFKLTGERLAALIAERAFALWMRTSDSAPLPGPHVLQRVVVGQRLGQLLQDARTLPYFRAALERELAAHFERLGFAHTYPSDAPGELTRERWLRCSSLRGAPALGAAASALAAWSPVDA